MKKWLLRASFLTVLGIFLSGLTACSRTPGYIKNPLISNLPSYQQERLKYMAASGIQVIKRGMIFEFIIPTDAFFNRRTRLVKEDRRDALYQLAYFTKNYMNYFARPRVKVLGHSDKVWKYPARRILSLHYAQSIAAFLWHLNIHPQVMVVKGEGAKHPIASNRYPVGTAYNRRVVVKIT